MLGAPEQERAGASRGGCCDSVMIWGRFTSELSELWQALSKHKLSFVTVICTAVHRELFFSHMF